MIVLTIVISLLYSLLIIGLILGFDRVKLFKIPENIQPKTKFTIIIPFRNEEENLPELLNSLALLNYPIDFFEILLVNDASDDSSVKLIQRFKERYAQLDISLLENQRKSGSPKKDAIALAISKANFEWIVTTDADCVVPLKWLKAFDALLQQKELKLIAAPLVYRSTHTFIEKFQLVDVLSLQGATIGGFGIKQPFLCNGANMAYSINLFKELKGFDDNLHIASGDDIFLLEKALKKDPDKVAYLKSKEALVITRPLDNLGALFSQRKRWAAKSRSYKNPFGKIVGLTVLIMNLLLIILMIVGLLQNKSWKLLLIIFIIKSSLDLILILKTASFLKIKKPLLTSFLSSFLYPFFTVFIAIISQISSYSWKGRTFKQ